MQWNHPERTRWLLACLAGLGISVWVGGFTLSMAVMFLVIFAVGAALLDTEQADTEQADTEQADTEQADAT